MLTLQTPTTLYPTREHAERVALQMNLQDTERWTYKVIFGGKYFLIEIYDETDEYVGLL